MATINYYGKLFNSPKITPAIARAAHTAAVYGKGLIAARTPVDTGALKASWTVRVEGNGVRIANSANYAGFVEFGTRKMAPREMMTSSLPDIQSVFIEELYKDVGEAIGGDLLADFAKPGYGNAVTGNSKYPQVGKDITRPIKDGLSKRTKQTSKNFLFPDTKNILGKRLLDKVSAAKPRYAGRNQDRPSTNSNPSLV
jgi:hypothetical protein